MTENTKGKEGPDLKVQFTQVGKEIKEKFKEGVDKTKKAAENLGDQTGKKIYKFRKSITKNSDSPNSNPSTLKSEKTKPKNKSSSGGPSSPDPTKIALIALLILGVGFAGWKGMQWYKAPSAQPIRR